MPRKGARVVAKTLKSAMANAEDLKLHKPEYQDIKTETLCASSWPWPAPPGSIKRFTPKARGSAGPIIKRNCHVKIVLSDE